MATVSGSHSEFVIDSRILFPNASPSDSPLQLLIDCNTHEVWSSKAAQYLVLIKWEQFGRSVEWTVSTLHQKDLFQCRQRFWRDAIPFIILVALVVAAVLEGANHSQCGGAASSGLMATIGIVSLLLLLFEEGPELVTEKLSYFMEPFNYLSVGSYVFLIIVSLASFLDCEWYQTNRPVLLSVAALALFFRVLEFLSILRTTSAFVHMLRLMVNDLVQWLVIFIVFEMAFSLTFYELLSQFDTDERFDTFPRALLSTFILSAGDFQVPFIVGPLDDDESNLARSRAEVTASVLFVFLVFVVFLIYMNVLIAMMSKSYR